MARAAWFRWNLLATTLQALLGERID